MELPNKRLLLLDNVDSCGFINQEACQATAEENKEMSWKLAKGTFLQSF